MKPSRLLPMLAVAAALAALIAPASAGGGRQFGAPVHVGNDSLDMTGEPSIAVARDGTEYIVAPDGAGVRAPAALGGAGVGGSLIWRSTDHGRTWSRLGSYDIPTGGGDSDIAITPDGTLFASGLSYLACSTVSRSSDKGDTWLPMPVAGCGRTPVSKTVSGTPSTATTPSTRRSATRSTPRSTWCAAPSPTPSSCRR